MFAIFTYTVAAFLLSLYFFRTRQPVAIPQVMTCSALNRGFRVVGSGLALTRMEDTSYMLWYAWVFLVIAIIAAILGFGGIAAASAGIAKICFIIFIVLFLISLLAGRRRTI